MLDVKEFVAELGPLWGIASLGDSITVRLSTRFRRSLGNYRVRTGEIVLASWLVDAPEHLLQEVLCHEAAHAAAAILHDRRIRPHGKEWQALMEQAGFPARRQIPVSALPESHQALSKQTTVWEHRCPICQATRLGKTRVSRWRCRRCRDSGRAGDLVITRLPPAIAVDV